MIIDFYNRNGGGAVAEETARAISAETALKQESFADVEYDPSGQTINFYNGFNDKIGEIDASSFVIDGMIEDVFLSGSVLVIVFNTEAGKQDIEVDLTDIFNPDNYYDKSDIDEIVSGITEDIIEATSGLQETLVSGTNIKTINNQSILGAGNIEIQAGGVYSAGTNIDITDDVISVTGITVPTKTSDLTNDSGFVNSGDVQTQISTATADFVNSGDVQTQINTATEDFVSSEDVIDIVKLTQAEYDALTGVSSTTLSIIIPE